MRGPADILPAATERYGTKIALITSTRTMTFRALDEESERVAAGLRERGVQCGQTVSILAQNRWEWLVAYHGSMKAGAVVNPVNIMLTAQELAFVLRDCESVAIFVGAEHAATVAAMARDLPALRTIVSFDDAVDGAIDFRDFASDRVLDAGRQPQPDEPCTIGYTSGTTGYPKGAVQSHRAVLTNCALTATMHGRCDADVVVSALPVAHVYGNVVVNATWMAGGTVVLMERFAADAALRLITDHHATMFEGVPAMYATMLADPASAQTDFSSLTRCTVGGQTMPLSTIEQWEQRTGARLIELWGMTEISGLGATHSLHMPPRPGSIGMSLPGVQLRIADLTDTSRDAPPGTAGELMVRGPIVMLGYHRNAEATADTLQPDGWLHTGDIGYADADGHYFIVDRRNDLIITGGYNVYPAEIERVLGEHPAVAVVAVGPVPDPIKGELACAYVVVVPGTAVSADELRAYASRRLAAYKRPRHIRFVDDMPKTSSGKIMRRELIRMFESSSEREEHE